MTSIYTQETMLVHTTFYVTNRSAECGFLFNGEEIETHHILPVKQGGSDDMDNLEHLHKGALHQSGMIYN